MICGIPKLTLSTTLKNKDKIDEAVALGSTNCAKRLRKPMVEYVKAELSKQFKVAEDSNIPLLAAFFRDNAKNICISVSVGLMAGYEDIENGMTIFVKRRGKVYCRWRCK